MDSEEAYDKFIPHTFIKRTNHIRAGKIEDYLANQFSLGVNRYPFILENTANMMIIYKKYVNKPIYTGKKNQQPK